MKSSDTAKNYATGLIKTNLLASDFSVCSQYLMPASSTPQKTQLEPDLPYRLLPATESTGPIIISAPHGGTHYPDGFSKIANLSRMSSLEDSGTADIAVAAATSNRPALIATMPRAVIDLNRPADAIDPLLWTDAPQPSQPKWNRYIKAGYGIIPRLDANQKPLYIIQPSISEQQARLSQIYKPYHDKLLGLISNAQLRHSASLLVDIHSMPAAIKAGDPRLPDFIFGDLHGVTLPAELKNLIDTFMQGANYQWGWNHPFAGGHITQHYGTGNNAIFCLQIEVNRSLFVRSTGINRPALEAISSHITDLLNKLAAKLSRDQEPLA